MLRHEQRQIVLFFCDGALMRIENEIRQQRKSNFQECSEVAVRAGIKQGSQPAVEFNESREAEHEWPEVSTSPSTEIRIQFTSVKYESKQTAKLACVRG